MRSLRILSACAALAALGACGGGDDDGGPMAGSGGSEAGAGGGVAGSGGSGPSNMAPDIQITLPELGATVDANDVRIQVEARDDRPGIRVELTAVYMGYPNSWTIIDNTYDDWSSATVATQIDFVAGRNVTLTATVTDADGVKAFASRGFMTRAAPAPNPSIAPTVSFTSRTPDEGSKVRGGNDVDVGIEMEDDEAGLRLELVVTQRARNTVVLDRAFSGDMATLDDIELDFVKGPVTLTAFVHDADGLTTSVARSFTVVGNKMKWRVHGKCHKHGRRH